MLSSHFTKRKLILREVKELSQEHRQKCQSWDLDEGLSHFKSRALSNVSNYRSDESKQMCFTKKKSKTNRLIITKKPFRTTNVKAKTKTIGFYKSTSKIVSYLVKGEEQVNSFHPRRKLLKFLITENRA